MAPRYKDHPLYYVRGALIISAAVGVVLCLIAVVDNSSYDSGVFAWATFFSFLSGCLCVFDLVSYKMRTATDPDNTPDWPLRKYTYGDLIFAVLLQWIFWPMVSTIGWDYYGYHNVVLQSYAALPAFVSSILHAISFWKEFMARKKANWLATQPLLPCSVCGAFSDNTNTQAQQPLRNDADEIEDLRKRFYYITPEDTSNESEVLLPKEFDSGYGAIGDREAGPSKPSMPSKKSKSSKGKKAEKAETQTDE